VARRFAPACPGLSDGTASRFGTASLSAREPGTFGGTETSLTFSSVCATAGHLQALLRERANPRATLQTRLRGRVSAPRDSRRRGSPGKLRAETFRGVARPAHRAPGLPVSLRAWQIARRDFPRRYAPDESYAESLRVFAHLAVRSPRLSAKWLVRQTAHRVSLRRRAVARPRCHGRSCRRAARSDGAILTGPSCKHAGVQRGSRRRRSLSGRLIDHGVGGGAPLPVGWERVGEGPGERGQG
jgi:hypothetical protein